jgi:NADH-quinone oxidoreductase subunit A
MTGFVAILLIFLGVGVFFVFFHLVLGRVVRPTRPDPEKLTIYECGEPTIGSAWVQFDLRYYVVALLFVIFDVEVAFFFPWAVVFGKSVALGNENLSDLDRTRLTAELIPGFKGTEKDPGIKAAAAKQFASIALIDILVFFGVLLVGFAYLWKRGDIDWVRSIAAERAAAGRITGPPATSSAALVGAGRNDW